MNVVLELNHPYRDLAGICQLAKYLLNNDAIRNVYIVPLENMREFFLTDEVIIDIAIFGNPRSNWIKNFKRSGVYTIIHESEGIPYCPELIFHNVSKTIQLAINEIWIWGENQKKTIEKNRKLKYVKGKIFVTGSVRYEFYKQRKMKQRQKPNVLQLNTNFPTISPRYQSFKEEMEMFFSDITKVRSEFLSDLLRSAILRERIVFYFAKLLEGKSENIKAALRPHPFEDFSYYVSHPSLKNFNLDIKTDSDIHEDLDNCFACINIGSQSTLDCIIRGTIPISPEPFGNIWDDLILLPSEFKSIDDIYNNYDKYNKIISNKVSSSNIDKYLFNFKYNIEIEEKIRNTVNQILKSRQSNTYKLYLINKSFIDIQFKIKNLIRNILFLFRIKIRKYSNKSKIWNKKKSINFINTFCEANSIIWSNYKLDIFKLSKKYVTK